MCPVATETAEIQVLSKNIIETGDAVFFSGVKLPKAESSSSELVPIRDPDFVNEEYAVGLQQKIATAWSMGMPMLVEGGTSIGKNRAAKQMAARLGYEVHYFNFDGKTDPEDMMGGMKPNTTGDGPEYIPNDGAVTKALRQEKGKKKVLILDEIGAARPNMLIRLHEVLDAYEKNGKVIWKEASGEPLAVDHSHTLIIAFTNTPEAGFLMRDPLDPAQIRRWVYDKEPAEIPDATLRYATRALFSLEPMDKVQLNGNLRVLSSREGALLSEQLSEIPGMEEMIGKYLEFHKFAKELVRKQEVAKDQPQRFTFDDRVEPYRVREFIRHFYNGDLNTTMQAALRYFYANKLELREDREKLEEAIILVKVQTSPAVFSQRKAIDTSAPSKVEVKEETSPNQFTPEQKRALEAEGYVILTLSGRKLSEYASDGRLDLSLLTGNASNIAKRNELMASDGFQEPAYTGEVAIPPGMKFAYSETKGKTTQEQQEMFDALAIDLKAKGIMDIRVGMGTAQENAGLLVQKKYLLIEGVSKTPQTYIRSRGSDYLIKIDIDHKIGINTYDSSRGHSLISAIPLVYPDRQASTAEVSIISPEHTFSPVQKEKLELSGYRVFHLDGISLADQIQARNDITFHSTTEADIAQTYNTGGYQGDIAIPPESVFDSSNSTNLALEDQEELIKGVQLDIERSFPGFKVDIGQAGDYLQLIYREDFNDRLLNILNNRMNRRFFIRSRTSDTINQDRSLLVSRSNNESALEQQSTSLRHLRIGVIPLVYPSDYVAVKLEVTQPKQEVITTPETITEGDTSFSPEQKQALESNGYTIVRLEGLSYKELQAMGLDLETASIFDLNAKGIKGDVAVPPTSVFNPNNSVNSTLDQQQTLVTTKMRSLTAGVSGITALIATPADYLALVQKLGSSGRVANLLKNDLLFLRTSTPTITNPDRSIVVGKGPNRLRALDFAMSEAHQKVVILPLVMPDAVAAQYREGRPIISDPEEIKDNIISAARITKIKELSEYPTETPRELRGGSNTVQIVHLTGDGDGVYKPGNGERSLGDFSESHNKLYQREVGAYIVNRALGFDLVPPTVKRTIRGSEGSLQEFIPGSVTKAQISETEISSYADQLYAMSLFDYIIWSKDRKNANILIHKDSHKLWSIDNGISFDSWPTDTWFGTLMSDNLSLYLYGKEAPLDIKNKLRTFMADATAQQNLRRELAGLFPEARIDALFARIKRVDDLLTHKGFIKASDLDVSTNKTGVRIEYVSDHKQAYYPA